MQTVQVSILRDLIYGAVKRGVNFEDILNAIDLTTAQLTDAESHVHWEKAGRFWKFAVEKTGDEQLGLHIGQEAGFTFLGTLSFLAQNCKTAGDAYRTIIKFNDTVTSVFRYGLKETDDAAGLIFEPLPIYNLKYPEGARQAVEISMANFLTSIKLLTDRSANPIRAELAFPKRNPAEYENVLGVPVTFNSESNILYLSREDFNLPIIRHDQSLFSLLNNVLLHKLENIKQNLSLTENIKKAILVSFKGQAPPVEIIADHFHLTARTLQRRLADEEITYREIVNLINKEISDELLALNVKKEKIASLLGYVDTSTLRRKSKVWKSV